MEIFLWFVFIAILLFPLWFVGLVSALLGFRRKSERSHEIAKLYLFWSFFPLYFLIRPKRVGIGKSILLFIFSPTGFVLGFIALFIIAYWPTFTGVPSYISYRDANDLERITGVKFPEVVPVDSTCEGSFGIVDEKIEIKFVPTHKLDEAFYKRLEEACKNDSCCWHNRAESYYYFIFPEHPIDRPNGSHRRLVEIEEGRFVDEWDGDYIEVLVPKHGDTITVVDGWFR